MKKHLKMVACFVLGFAAGFVFFYLAGINVRSIARTTLNQGREVYRAVMPQSTTKSSPEIFAPLGEPFASVLGSMYSAQSQMGTDGIKHPLNVTSGITPEQGSWMYSFYRKVKPQRSLEVGFAHGFSTIFMLAALKANGHGMHAAIDPFEITAYHGTGLRKIEELGLAKSFRFIENRSEFALPALAAENQFYDFIFIDGSHLFDDVMMDFSLADNLCAQGGYIILHDTWMGGIRRVVSFIDRNRADYVRVKEAAENFAVYQKREEDRRDWQYFVEF